MKNLEKYKTTLIAVTLFVLAFAMYNFFGSKDAVSTGEEANSIGTDVVELYNGLKKVTLDRSTLNTTLYKSLIDWSPVLLGQAVGRSNPFAPIGE